MLYELASRVKTVGSLHPQAATATATGDGVDLAQFESAAVLFHLGAWTDGTHTFSIEESADDGDTDAYSTVAAGDLDGTPPVASDATGDDTVTKVGYLGSTRWLRVVNTVTGGPSTGQVFSAAVVAGDAESEPVD